MNNYKIIWIVKVKKMLYACLYKLNKNSRKAIQILEVITTGQQERQLLLALFETLLLLPNDCILYMLFLLLIGHVFSNFILSARIFKMLMICLY